MSELPFKWTATRLGDIIDVVRGIAFPTEAKGIDSDDRVACLRTKNVQETVEWNDLLFIPETYVRRIDQYVRLGDILISTANSYELVGKVAYLADVPRNATIGAFISILRTEPCIDSKFVYFQLASPLMRSAIRKTASTTTNISNISLSKCLEFEFLLPPLAEQRRIVAEIEKQFTRLDEAVGTVKSVRRKLQRSATSLLAATLKMVSHEQINCESNSEHLTDGTFSRLGKMLPDPEIKIQVPSGWVLRSLDQLTDKITSGSRDWSPYYGRGTGTFILAQNVRPRRLDFSSRQLVDPPDHDSSRIRSCVEQGDLLVTIVGANTGDICPVAARLQEHYVSQSVALLRPLSTHLTKYLSFYLSDECYGRAIWNGYTYGAGRPHLSFEQLRKTPVLLPPPHLVENFTSRMEALETLFLNSEQSAKQVLSYSSRLRQAILAKAFSGQLVPQDPKDEPASVLLERIRAERITDTAAPRRRRRQRDLALHS